MIIGGERSAEWPEADSLTCCRMMMRTRGMTHEGWGAGFPPFPRDHRSPATAALPAFGYWDGRGQRPKRGK